MKKGTKITVFIASMALTVGSLMAIVSPRHCGERHHNTCTRHHQGNNGQTPDQDALSKAKTNQDAGTH
ncbi:MAG TPA: hypothetical protein PL029_09670 [Bacteroidia bacterium]|nr:hypothetical protein [Bacteroidia bacterium]